MLTIFGIVAIIVFTIQVYKTAAGTERNAPLWAIITAVTGIGLQFVVPFFFGLVLAIYYLATGTPQDQLESEIYGMATIIGLLGLVLSVVGMYLVVKFVSRVKDEPRVPHAPPPPPTFDRDL
jgi:putative Mn2+ efflux pump MntP